MLVSLMFKFFHKDVCVELPVFLSFVMSTRYCHHGSLFFQCAVAQTMYKNLTDLSQYYIISVRLLWTLWDCNTSYPPLPAPILCEEMWLQWQEQIKLFKASFLKLETLFQFILISYCFEGTVQSVSPVKVFFWRAPDMSTKIRNCQMEKI